MVKVDPLCGSLEGLINPLGSPFTSIEYETILTHNRVRKRRVNLYDGDEVFVRGKGCQTFTRTYSYNKMNNKQRMNIRPMVFYKFFLCTETQFQYREKNTIYLLKKI